MRKYFNLAAIIFYQLLNLGETTIMQHYNKYKSIIVYKTQNFAEIIENGYCACSKFLTDKITKSDIDICLSYLLALDKLCGSNSIVYNNLFSGMPLNNEYRQRIEIYITFAQNIRHGNSASDNLNFIFTYLIFFKKNNQVHENIIINNIYITDITSPIRLGFIPYPKDCEGINKDKSGNIIIETRTELNKADKSFLEQCNKAVYNDGCDIIFGPEIHGAPHLDKLLKDHCCKNGCKVIICPSYHIEKDGFIMNQSTIYGYENNRVKKLLLKKSFAAQFYKGPPENIDENDNFNLVLVHIKNFGKLLILICKDYLTTDIGSLSATLNPDLIVIQSFSDKTSDFLAKMQSNASNKQCVILGNSCYITSNCNEKGTPAYPMHLTKFNYNHSKHEINTETITQKCPRTDCWYSNCRQVFELTVADGKLIITKLSNDTLENEL